MKYLFIVTESASANGICTLAVMKELAREAEIFCITNREPGMRGEFRRDGIHWQTVKPRLVYRMGALLSRRDILPLRWLRFVLDRAKLVLTLPVWPLHSLLYARRIERAARRLCRREKIDCIVPVYSQIDTLIAAARIKKRHPQVLYVPYFLDSLSGGYGLRIFSPKQTVKRGLAWERKLLKNADRIIAMESSRGHHRHHSAGESYYSRMVFLDLPLLGEPIQTEPVLDPEKRNLVYVGTMPRGIRSPEYLLNVYRHLRGENYRFWFVGCEDCPSLTEAAKRDGRIRLAGRCSHRQALAYEAGAAALVNIGSRNPGMTPSKLFEYLSFGKPIISTAGSEEEPCRGYLQKYPAALILDENQRDFEAAARRLEAFLEQAASVEPEQVRRLYVENTPQATAAFLRSCAYEDPAHQLS